MAMKAITSEFDISHIGGPQAYSTVLQFTRSLGGPNLSPTSKAPSAIGAFLCRRPGSWSAACPTSQELPRTAAVPTLPGMSQPLPDLFALTFIDGRLFTLAPDAHGLAAGRVFDRAELDPVYTRGSSRPATTD